MEGLPREVKLKIFKYLEPVEIVRCSAVSREWYSCCFDFTLWETVTVLDWSNCSRSPDNANANAAAAAATATIPSRGFQKLLTVAGPGLKVLQLQGCKSISKGSVEAICKYATNLKELNLDGCAALHSAIIRQLIIQNSLLESLCLPPNVNHINDSFCIGISSNCSNLKSLDISFCRQITKLGLMTILQHCQSLSELRASSCPAISSTRVMTTLHSMPCLSLLDISDCKSLSNIHLACLVQGSPDDANNNNNDDDDDENEAQSTTLENLQHLTISGCSRISNIGLYCLMNKLPNLVSLSLAGNSRISNQALCDLVGSFNKLENLDLEECAQADDSVLESIGHSRYVHKLVYLNLSSCDLISGEMIARLVSLTTSLRKLILDNTSMDSHGLFGISDAMDKRCNGSHSLDLVTFDCPAINWVSTLYTLSKNSTRANGVLVILKSSHELQQLVKIHTNLVLNGNIKTAQLFEKNCKNFMSCRSNTKLTDDFLREMQKCSFSFSFSQSNPTRSSSSSDSGCVLM